MKRNNKNNKQQKNSFEYKKIDLNDIGLEPPKIYREAQQRVDRNKNNKKAKSNISINEKRAKQTKKRKKRNKIRKILLYIVTFVTVFVVSGIIIITQFFNIDTIDVKGNKLYNDQEILSAFTITNGDNLVLSDTDKAVKRLQEILPYVYSVDIKRKLPATLEINITEAKERYSIKLSKKKYILLDDNLKVLKIDSKTAKGIHINDVELVKYTPGNQLEIKDKKALQRISNINSILKAEKINEITSIGTKGENDNYVVYDGRIKFKLGSLSDATDKIYKGLAACSQLDETNPNSKGEMDITNVKNIYFAEQQ